MNKFAKAVTGLALATGLAIAGTTPAQAATYSFTTNCPSGTHTRVLVYASASVYTSARTNTGATRSGYGNWNWDTPIRSGTITYTTSYANVSYQCRNN